jgi:class 3 adenylate cyclase
VIEGHDGILLKVEGDSLLVIFRNVAKGISSAVEMQRILSDYNNDKPAEEQVLLCVGLGYGEVLRIGDADVFGTEVNAASKLGEDAAMAREILVTDSVKEAMGCEGAYSFEQIEDLIPGTKAAYRLVYHFSMD